MKNKKRAGGKKGDFQLSFQFIFSIILVVVVLFVGFYVIKMFLNEAGKAKLLDFTNELKNSDGGVMDIWREDFASQIISLPLSNDISYVCFANPAPGHCTSPADICANITRAYGQDNTGGYNMFFIPLGKAEEYGVSSAQTISCNNEGVPVKVCIDTSTTTCIPVVDGVVKMRLLKQNETSEIQVLQASP